jgi:DNA-binding response OmpR family regulator
MRILLVEDEKDIIGFLKPSLEAECFVVDIARDGEKGSFLARSNNYDLIILDNMLPKKSGKEICQELRKAHKNIPIIMLSVLAETDKKIELLNCGADDYLTKPFSLEELLARVRALLRRPTIITSEVLTTDDLVLNSKKYTLTRGEKEIYLTKKEFMLLEYLMRNQGFVISRGMLLEHIWDMNADPFSNTVETHVMSLRKKIDSHDTKKLIYTISGRGYKIDDINNCKK